MTARKSNKPIHRDGKLVTPVTGEPASGMDYAPVCPSCKMRECSDCGTYNLHLRTSCLKCGGDRLRDPTRSRGTVVMAGQRRQKCKCLVCGFTWTRSLPTT